MFMRTPPARRAGARRRFLPYLVGAFFVYLAASGLSGLWTDLLWFESVGYAGIWWTRQLVHVALIVGFVAVSFLFIFGNLSLADRSAMRHLGAPGTEEDEMLAQVRQWLDQRLPAVRLVGSIVLALLIGGGAGGWTDRIFLFLNQVGFGIADPLFGHDLGFYVFRLPLIRDLLVWGFNLFLVTTLAVAGAHYVNGALRIRRGGDSFFSRGAKVQVSLLLAGLALLRAGLYRIDAYRLLYSNRSDTFFGAGYTDVFARLPALHLLLAVSLVTAVILIVNIWRKGWTLPVVAGAAWIVVAVGAGVIYPAVIENLRVVPNPIVRQGPYIERNIAFTRQAFGVDNVEVQPFAADDSIQPGELTDAQALLDNLRLWDPDVLTNSYSPQEFREYYRLQNVDSDRYLIDGELTQVMLSVRELESGAIDENNWQVRRLSYTHGFGLVASYAAQVGQAGAPRYLVSELPPESVTEALEIEQPRIYFGELDFSTTDPVIVRNQTGEIDYPTGANTFASTDYAGQGGVQLSNIWRRLAFALRHRDLNIVISDQIRADSRILPERDIDSIVAKVAPFLASDSDPYPVVSNGRISWVIDMYTYTGNYPYSTPLSNLDRRRLAQGTGIRAGVNYIRNSVKAVVDAYDGTVTFYVVDENDPILAAWRSAFPALFVEMSAMPEGLRSHLRYPMDLFTVQSEVYRDYHVTDVPTFFNELDAWAIPQSGAFDEDEAPVRAQELVGDGISAVTGRPQLVTEALPYYTMLRVDNELSFVGIQAFAPRDRPNLVSFLLVGSDPTDYGRLIDYRMASGSQVTGIEQVGLRIESDPNISAQFSLWRSRGSRVLQGDVLVLPIGDSLLYAQSIFLEATGGGIPEFERVIVLFEDRIEWSTTLGGALAAIFGEDAGDIGEEPPPTDVAELLQQANDALAEADQALREGDLAEYQRLVDAAADLIEQALALSGGGAEARVTPTVT